MAIRSYTILLCLILASQGCSTQEEDVHAWMRSQETTMKGRVQPLPAVSQYPSVTYSGHDLLNPFEPGRIEPEQRVDAVQGGPDLTRPREPLEAFPLESIRFVGVLMQEGDVAGLVRVGSTLHQVREGNYLGQDFGLIVGVDETQISLLETVEDMNGQWVERTSTLLLQEQ